jgi:hypothetical protein
MSLHPFYLLFVVEIVIAVTAYTNIAEYVFMPVKERTVRYISDKRLHFYLALAFGLLFLFHAFKNPLTLDDIPLYVDAFHEANNVSWRRVVDMGYESFKTETGFALVIKAISSLFSSDQMLFVLTSAFILSAVYFSVRQYSPILWVSVFVFMTDSFPQSLFVLRAFIAIGIYLFAFPFIISRKIVPFLMLSGIAFSVHMSSVLFLPVYFLYGIKNWRYLLMVLLIIAVSTMIGFKIFLPLFVEYVIPEYAYYIIYANEYEGASWKMPALLSAILLFRIVVMKSHFFEEGINRLLSIVMIFAVIVYVAGMGYGLTSRMAMYFTNMTFLILPNTLQYIKSSSWQFACAAIYILFNSFFFFKSTSDILWMNYQLIEI